jgi:TatD DNase family protein
MKSMKNHTITHAIQIGCDIPTSEKAIFLAKTYPDIFRATVGLHPADAQKYSLSEIQLIIEQIEQMILVNPDLVVGIGEMGLDFHYLSDNPDADKQKQYLAWELQSKLAQKNHLPMVIHTRDAREDTFNFIKEHKLENIIMHCYSEDRPFADRLMGLSDRIYFSFSGILTYPKATAIQEAAAYIPLDRILIETDAPFLSPQPVRGTVNEPANVRYVLEKLCELRSESSELIEQTVYENSRRIFGL